VTAAAGGRVPRGGLGQPRTGQVSIVILAGAILAGGVLAEVAAPGRVTLLSGADFAAGACYAVVGAWLLRAGHRSRGWLALAVSAAWFLGTGVTAWPAALPSYGAAVAVLGYRAFLTHLLLLGLGGWRAPGQRAAWWPRLMTGACYAAVLLPVPADGFGTAGLMASLAILASLAMRWAAADRRPVVLVVSVAAGTLAVAWWLAASGVADGNGLTVANDVALIVAAVAVAAGSSPQRWLPGAIHGLVVDLGPSRHAELPVSDLLAGALADPELEVRYAIPGRGWVDEQGRPVEPPPAAGPGTERVTRVPAPGGGEVALIGGPDAGTGSALSRAAAAAAALALESARISAEVREQAEAVRESRQRLLAVADEERQALAAQLRAGPGELLEKVDQILAGLDDEAARDIRGQLADAVHDLEQLALGLFPATLGARPVGVLVREIAAGMPVPVRIDVDGPVDDLPPGLRALIYFFCSECLANTAKHAGASAAAVCVNAAGGRLTVSVHDDGRGGVSLAGSRGLRGLADRVEVAGGTLSVVSPAGGPTRISAEIPAPLSLRHVRALSSGRQGLAGPSARLSRRPRR
jgi:signal transduction histidine kinase